MLRLRVFSMVLVLLAAGASAGEIERAQPKRAGLDPDRLERIDRLMETRVERGDLVGAMGMIVRDDKLAYANAWGLADREDGRPMTTDTIFRIYSMSKPITSIAVMMLYEEGLFELNDPVSRYLPELGKMKVLIQKVPLERRTASWLEDDSADIVIDPDSYELVDADREITVRDLLRHTSGLTYGIFGNTIVDQMYRQKRVLRDDDTLAEFVAKLGELPLQFQPGTRYHYSVSTDVLGRLAEVLSGMPYDEFLQERIFGPLDMRDTGFSVPPHKLRRFAQMYTPNDDGALEVSDYEMSRGYIEGSRFLSGGGGLVSTARDYARFCQLLVNGGELDGARLLSPKTIELITANHMHGIETNMPAGGYTFGLGFAVSQDLGLMAAPGSVGEFNWGGAAGTRFWIDPTERMVGVFMVQIIPHSYNFATQFKNLSYMSIVK